MIGDHEIRKAIGMIGDEIRRYGNTIETYRIDNIVHIFKVEYDGKLYKLTYSDRKHDFVGIEVVE